MTYLIKFKKAAFFLKPTLTPRKYKFFMTGTFHKYIMVVG